MVNYGIEEAVKGAQNQFRIFTLVSFTTVQPNPTRVALIDCNLDHSLVSMLKISTLFKYFVEPMPPTTTTQPSKISIPKLLRGNIIFDRLRHVFVSGS